ncbi:Mbeg1-like protein [Endothiovibrio diazotrophicus]
MTPPPRLRTTLPLLAILLLPPTLRAGEETVPRTAAPRTIPDTTYPCDLACATRNYPYAVLSLGTYESEDLAAWNGWQRIRVDEDGSTGYRASIYRHDGRREIAIAYAGTDALDLNDWLTDVELLFAGSVPAQYRQGGVTALNTLVEMGGDAAQAGYRLTLTGHSLGGGMAQFVGRVLHRRATTFNTLPIADDVSAAALMYDDYFSREAPQLQGDGEEIVNLVARDGDDGYDIAADWFSGDLWGTTYLVDVEVDDLLFSIPDLYQRHALGTLIDALQRRLTTATLGGLTVNDDWACAGQPQERQWTIFADGTFRAIDWSDTGIWWLEGTQVNMVDDGAVTYRGSIGEDGVTLSGAMEGDDGRSGCWQATYTPQAASSNRSGVP